MGEKEIRKILFSRRNGIKQRCFSLKAPSYRSYGAKGISLSKDWLDFENFYRDMKKGFHPHLVIDRIDPYKGYSKNNCRWITVEENLNRSKRMRTKLSFKKEFQIQESIRDVRNIFPDLVFLLKKEGYNQVDIASIMNCSPSKISTTLNSLHPSFRCLLVKK